MGIYRGRVDIIADILKVAENRVKKTQIMYQANLSYTVLQKYLAEVAHSSLIVFEEENQRYRLTDKGREFLVLYKEYSKANKYVEKRLTNVRVKRRLLDKLCKADSSKSSQPNRKSHLPVKTKMEEAEFLS